MRKQSLTSKLLKYLTIYNMWSEAARKISSACSLNTQCTLKGRKLEDPKGFPSRDKFALKIVNLYTEIMDEIHRIRQIIKNSRLEEAINSLVVLEKLVDTKTGFHEKRYRILCKSKELAELVIKYIIGMVDFEPQLVKENNGWTCKVIYK